MTILKDRVLRGVDFVGDMAIALGKMAVPYAKEALAVGLILKGSSRALKADDQEDLDSLLARIRMPRHLALDWSDIQEVETTTDMATPSAKALDKAKKDE